MMAAMKQQSNIYLSELLDGFVEVPSFIDCEVTGLQMDSRQLEKDNLFIAFQGVEKHGLEFLESAVTAGACGVLYEYGEAKAYSGIIEKYKNDIALIGVESLREFAGVVADRFYQHPSSKMHLVAVTGTDGKTSVTRFVAQAMSAVAKTAVIGTTGNGVWGDIKTSTHTTPDVLSLHKLLFDFCNQNTECVAMEVSSHGIDQQRIAGVDIDTAVLTNVSRDHLDYHGSVENYQQVKKQLFNLSSVKNIVVNVDDEVGKDLLAMLSKEKNAWAYGFSAEAKNYQQYLCVDAVEINDKGFNVQLNTSLGDVSIVVPLLGQFNISNVLSVLAVMLINKVDINKAVQQIALLQTAPGRMECFTAESKATVVVDYAHTPNALKLALESVRQHFSGKVWCVFGCGGDRDQGKRPMMGAEADRIADIVVVTDDNPRHEKSRDIIEQILSGFKNRESAIVIADRQQAIEYACKNAQQNDVVLIAGKGHEEFQIVGDIRSPFSDRQLARQCVEVLQ